MWVLGMNPYPVEESVLLIVQTMQLSSYGDALFLSVYFLNCAYAYMEF